MNILGITDLNYVGSGYSSLSLPIFDRLAKRGHTVKVIGLANNGSQHDFPFTIFPAQNIKEADAILHNILEIWKVDVVITLMDIPYHKGFFGRWSERPFKYVGVFPVEAGPLSFTWAMALMQMDKPYVISEFGVEEAHKRGVSAAEYLPVGIDLHSWKPPSPEERKKVRETFGVDDETFVVLTVADNQERKNLPACFEAFALFAKDHPNSKYMLVTREHLHVGWEVQELASTYGIADKLMIFERGLPFAQLWMLYASADAFLLLSKAEGRGLPLTEAMAMRVPCVGTDCTGIRDQLKDKRGFLVPVEYVVDSDPFGNANRFWASPEDAARMLWWIKDHPEQVQEYLDNASQFVQGLDWDKTVDILENYLRTVEDGEA
jgi:glycosyltransferase involved in cell wall biosynthesis